MTTLMFNIPETAWLFFNNMGSITKQYVLSVQTIWMFLNSTCNKFANNSTFFRSIQQLNEYLKKLEKYFFYKSYKSVRLFFFLAEYY